jgi:hypothetical protein
MKKKTLVIMALAASFGLGFAFNAFLTKATNAQTKMKRVTGIGGIFFKCKDPAKVREWYQKHLA